MPDMPPDDLITQDIDELLEEIADANAERALSRVNKLAEASIEALAEAADRPEDVRRRAEYLTRLYQTVATRWGEASPEQIAALLAASYWELRAASADLEITVAATRQDIGPQYATQAGGRPPSIEEYTKAATNKEQRTPERDIAPQTGGGGFFSQDKPPLPTRKAETGGPAPSYPRTDGSTSQESNR
jgi:hypothetical protein